MFLYHSQRICIRLFSTARRLAHPGPNACRSARARQTTRPAVQKARTLSSLTARHARQEPVAASSDSNALWLLGADRVADKAGISATNRSKAVNTSETAISPMQRH